jgi:hypothetical protein
MCQNNTLSTFLSMLILHPIKLPPRYDWNTVEYGVNHHNPNPGDFQYQNQTWLYMWLGWSHHFKCFTVTTITWLTATEYLCYKWPRIWSTCRIHNPVLSTFMTYHRVSSKSNTTGATFETETFSLSDELTPGFLWGSYCLICSFLWSV